MKNKIGGYITVPVLVLGLSLASCVYDGGGTDDGQLGSDVGDAVSDVTEAAETYDASEICDITEELVLIADAVAYEHKSGFDLAEWKESHTKVRGIYLTGPVAGSERLSDILALIDSTDINAVVLDIKNDEGHLTFKPTHGTPYEIDAGVRYISDIEALMETFKEHDIYTIGRIVCFKDPVLAEAKPECALFAKDGEAVAGGDGMAWVNPCSEEVTDYLVEIGEYCADLGFDEVQYDYVRFPVVSDADNIDFGVSVTAGNKHEYIERFLEKATARLHPKGIAVTVDVFGTVIGNETDIGVVGQDYAALASRVDALCPMVYPSHYNNGVFGIEVPDARPYDTVYAAMMLSAEETKDTDDDKRAVVRPWLQAFTAPWVDGHIEYTNGEISEQIQAANDAGCDEWLLWNAKNDYEYTGQ